jgi:hypothetical protein
MTRQDVRAAAIAAGVGLAIIVLIAAVGLIQRVNMDTSGGGPPQDGDLIAIPTPAPLVDAEGQALCHDALLAGRLVAHPAWGLAIQAGSDAPLRIVWPFGYAGRVAGDRIELLDHRHDVVARSGDSIEMGGPAANVKEVEGFGACPNSIRLTAAQP